MIRYKEIAFTAYAVLDMKKARKFYEGVLGLKVSRELSENFIEYDIGSGTLVVACAPDEWKPSKEGTSAALEVADFDAAIKHLKKKRITFAIGPRDYPTCTMVGIRDPDGNLICLHQVKKKKKPGKKK
jgi:catechol 2,3-dioxygenase-like lactoylglutathione lyase family enzyme